MGVHPCVGECRSARSIVTIYIVAVGERHGSAVYALSRRDDRCDLCLAGVIHAGCFHGNGQLRRFDLDGHSSGRSCIFAWKDGTIKPAANDSYEAEWVFTPASVNVGPPEV